MAPYWMSPPFAGLSLFAFAGAIAVIVVDATASKVVAAVEPVLLLVQEASCEASRISPASGCLQALVFKAIHQFYPRLLRRATLVHNGDASG